MEILHLENQMGFTFMSLYFILTTNIFIAKTISAGFDLKFIPFRQKVTERTL